MSQTIATKEAVESACQKIFSRQQRVPTYEEVVRELKGGSNTTIAKYLREWLSKREHAARASLPQSLEARCLAIVHEVWCEATTAAGAALNGERARIHEELRRSGAHVDELVAEVEALQRDLAASNDKVSELMIEVARREAILQRQAALEAANAAVVSEQDKIRRERDDARVAAGRLQGQVLELQRQLDVLMSSLPARVVRRRVQKKGQEAEQPHTSPALS